MAVALAGGSVLTEVPVPGADPSAGARSRSISPWWGFLARRLGRAVVSMLVVVTLAFLVLRVAGGDPVRNALGPTASPDLVADRRAQLGLDDPLPAQYLDYVAGLLRGDLGVSLITGRSVTDLVATRLPATLELAALAFALVLLLAIPIGLLVAVRTYGGRRRGTELVFTGVTGFLASVPDYLLGVLLVVVVSVNLRLLPVAGNGTAAAYVLPVIALALSSTCALARIARVEALDVLGEDYVRTARSKRLGAPRIYLRHVLPNMLTAVLTLGGSLLATLVTGSVLVERVFNWPGMGNAFVTAITTRDYGIVQGLALVYAAIVLVVNLLVDVVIALIDRRSTLIETS
ncbi:ABC transporter permease [Cellulomonas soli]|uniref:Peptide ABC transporter permease n=1 Tax=Cellulomonas soli TaxID=931535 RepID=A0A512PDI0_9CELL|nr:ABC transporter permease [Cellulomonas soli]NYI60076.1 peptide/nickel transport system permease protein [Cellulomonas soli]GEP69270.1 peptide ABC transporter permease [Cellulomonas soli]